MCVCAFVNESVWVGERWLSVKEDDSLNTTVTLGVAKCSVKNNVACSGKLFDGNTQECNQHHLALTLKIRLTCAFHILS